MVADLSDTTDIYKCSLTLQDLSKILLAYPKISRSCLQDLSLGVYSIPCLNAFVESVFSHMKSLWTTSRNLMVNESIAAELKIRLNSTMTCKDFFSFAQTQPQLIKCAKSQQKYSFEKKGSTISVNTNQESSL